MALMCSFRTPRLRAWECSRPRASGLFVLLARIGIKMTLHRQWVLASTVTSIPQTFFKIARQVKAADLHPRMIEFGMADRMVHVLLNQRLESRIPPTAMTQIIDAEQAIVNGKFVLPSQYVGSQREVQKHEVSGERM